MARSPQAFTTTGWRNNGEKYYGSGECFLFKIKPKLRTYLWTGKNQYFMMSNEDHMMIGGGTGVVSSTTPPCVSAHHQVFPHIVGCNGAFPNAFFPFFLWLARSSNQCFSLTDSGYWSSESSHDHFRTLERP
jgi:hypothetical protein